MKIVNNILLFQIKLVPVCGCIFKFFLAEDGEQKPTCLPNAKHLPLLLVLEQLMLQELRYKLV